LAPSLDPLTRRASRIDAPLDRERVMLLARQRP
jgi:hypothetical protein